MKIYKVYIDSKFPFVIGYFSKKSSAEALLKIQRSAADSPVVIEEIDVLEHDIEVMQDTPQ